MRTHTHTTLSSLLVFFGERVEGGRGQWESEVKQDGRGTLMRTPCVQSGMGIKGVTVMGCLVIKWSNGVFTSMSL